MKTIQKGIFGALGTPVSKSLKPADPPKRGQNNQNGALGAPFLNPRAYARAVHSDDISPLDIIGSKCSAPSAPPPSLSAFEARYGHDAAERAAILEYDGGLPRQEAERRAAMAAMAIHPSIKMVSTATVYRPILPRAC